MKYNASPLCPFPSLNGWVGLNRQWAVDDSDVARLVRWAAAKTEWRNDSNVPAGWFHATCAEIAQAMYWGRTKAHAWMHRTDLFEVRAEGRRGTWLRLRVDVRSPIPAQLRLPFAEVARREQSCEQNLSVQVAVITRSFVFSQPSGEQKSEQKPISPLHPPYKETEEVSENPSLHAGGREGKGNGQRAPMVGEWAVHMRSRVYCGAGNALALAFARPPAHETLNWLKQVGLRYDRTNREWKGNVSDDDRTCIMAACNLSETEQEAAKASLRGVFGKRGDSIYATRALLAPMQRSFLLMHGWIEICAPVQDAFGTHEGRWTMPDALVALIDGATVPPVAPIERVVEQPPAPAPAPASARVSAPVSASPAPALERRQPTAEQTRVRALWCSWVAACIEQGILPSAPATTPLFHKEDEARIDLFSRIAAYRGQAMTFSGIRLIERETADLLRRAAAKTPTAPEGAVSRHHAPAFEVAERLAKNP